MDELSLTRDAFLGGRVYAWQPRDGYRSGTDAVLLAAAVVAEAGETVLELGCGVGVASLCLAARIPGVAIIGVERDPAAADLASRNMTESDVPAKIFAADLRALPDDIRGGSFDHVMMNPPYFASGPTAPDVGRALARHEHVPLADWIETGLRRLRPRGQCAIIHKADRLPEILRSLEKTCGDIVATPIVGRIDKPASRVVVRARKGAKGPFSLSFPLIMHDGKSHQADTDGKSAAATAILRDGAPLDA